MGCEWAEEDGKVPRGDDDKIDCILDVDVKVELDFVGTGITTVVTTVVVIVVNRSSSSFEVELMT